MWEFRTFSDLSSIDRYGHGYKRWRDISRFIIMSYKSDIILTIPFINQYLNADTEAAKLMRIYKVFVHPDTDEYGEFIYATTSDLNMYNSDSKNMVLENLT